MKLINIGYGNLISSERMISVVSPDAAPIKRMVQDAKDKGTLIDASCGRKTKAVIFTDNGYIVLSALQPETIANRANNKEDTSDKIAERRNSDEE